MEHISTFLGEFSFPNLAFYKCQRIKAVTEYRADGRIEIIDFKDNKVTIEKDELVIA